MAFNGNLCVKSVNFEIKIAMMKADQSLIIG